jgi:excinuclease ABC subunit B
MTIRPTSGQVDDLLGEIRKRAGQGERVLVTTLTKKMAEDLTDYYTELGVRARYLHSDIDTLERIAILRDLRLGEFDVLIGVNLLREGLDLPEVSLVAIFDADKEGFLRSERSLIQTSGRAARNVNGEVIMYADKMTESIRKAMAETERRRAIQAEYNVTMGITPETVKSQIKDVLGFIYESDYGVQLMVAEETAANELTEESIKTLELEMKEAARRLEFEKAAEIRDRIKAIKERMLQFGIKEDGANTRKKRKQK